MNGSCIFHGEVLIHDDRGGTLTASRVQGGGKRGPTSVLIPSYFIHYADAFRISASSCSSASDYSLRPLMISGLVALGSLPPIFLAKDLFEWPVKACLLCTAIAHNCRP